MKRLGKQGEEMKILRCDSVQPDDLKVLAYYTPTLFNDRIKITVELKEQNIKAPVDLWGVDTDYDGEVFRSEREATAYRDKKGLCTEISIEIPCERASKRRIAVRAVDILGNISYAVIDGGKIFEQGRE